MRAVFGALLLATRVLAVLTAMVTGAPAFAQVVTYFHNDLSGSPILATNAAGAVVWKENYRPYGDKLIKSSASSGNKIGFHGKPFDNATGLSYMGARYYDPVLGRFVGVDPKGVDPGVTQEFNRYAYANNNPYRFVDPDGHSPLDVAFLVYDLGKLGLALYSGAGVGAAAADVALSAIGVASPLPGTGQALKAARAAEHSIEASRVAGVAREAATAKELAREYGERAVQREMYLRDAQGNIVKDSLTGEARRIDHVVIKEGKAVRSVETTSQTASKTAQQAKEDRIRDAGGTFVRDRETKKLIDLKEVPTELRRRF